ncbi:MAG: AmmeMemoRadiSam system radical SAM enzyme [Omnitrophica WOR_2 bacterium RIFCSPLOWO2_12_FULL_50_9]|nr:MAG: AmmeMemoRadiSam system radical SAM enzyme [Omnitrophica WOR_2 bacterium RIFCSPHIGHO2_02_FULL_50_17]OGX43425.1 MAG: AmmeMemoRadiSam system radical SAM enzyme [Omnitrophica WOR_2 bacterium RIFCSPLOWO2_12_FULL_50_9]
MTQLTCKNYPGRWWKKIDEKTILCELCPRYCHLHDGQRGFCFVRQNVGGEMVLTTYGRSSGFCIDPVEKKPLNHFYPGTSILSFGTAGCNLGCKFCQNWDISKSREFDRLTDEASPEKIARAAKALDCKSVAFTYNDPVIFAEYAIDIAKECHKLDVKTVAVTAGYITDEARPEFYTYMDAANVDLKGFTEEFYRNICFGALQPVLDTLVYLKHKTSVWFEITTLLIPGENDSDEELNAMTEWIVKEIGTDVPLHFTAFHPDYRMLDHPPTRPETLTRARQTALSKGIRYVYTGNVHDTEGASTYCHNCGQILIERDWYQLGAYNLKNKNQCSQCHAVCAGRFDDKPGTWGPRRQPVRLSDLNVR